MKLSEMREKLMKLERGSRILMDGKQYEVTGIFQFDKKRFCDTSVWLVENDSVEPIDRVYRIEKSHPRATANEMRIVENVPVLKLDWKARESDMHWDFVQ